jgi:hypothetical protein
LQFANSQLDINLNVQGCQRVYFETKIPILGLF